MSVPRVPSLRILIADDYPDILDSLALVFESHGHQVRAARDGLEAVQFAADFQPDVIVLDIGMPKLDGYATARQIRQHLGAQVMMIALTAWAREEDKQAARSAGFDEHMAKPPDIKALTRLFEQLGQQKQSRTEP
jgi:CheY-like chemotaxis protein